MTLVNRFADKVEALKRYIRIVGVTQTIEFLVRGRSEMEVSVQWEGSPNPIWLRAGTTDIGTFVQIFIDEEYDLPYELGPNRPVAIIDAGANIGLSSIWFASRFPGARIVAVEPERANYELLVKNVVELPNVTPVNAAVWSHSGTLWIDDPGEGTWGFRTREVDDAANGAGTTPCVTIADLISEHELGSVDLLKLDIEGAEKEVLSSPEEWIGKIGAIVIELHDRFKSGCARAFYDAVGEFPIEHTRGEHVLVARVSQSGR